MISAKARNIINSIKPNLTKAPPGPTQKGSAGYDNIRDDIEKTKSLREGSVEKVPVNDNDIANKKYVDDEVAGVTGIWEDNAVTTNVQLKTADDINIQDKFIYLDTAKTVGLVAVGGNLGVGLAPGKTLDMNDNKIECVVDPTADQDAATKKYTDDAIDTDITTHINTAQAHSDYLLNTGDTCTGDLDISQNLDVTGTANIDGTLTITRILMIAGNPLISMEDSNNNNKWIIRADNVGGGGTQSMRYRIIDVTNSKTPFQIEGNCATDSIYISPTKISIGNDLEVTGDATADGYKFNSAVTKYYSIPGIDFHERVASQLYSRAFHWIYGTSDDGDFWTAVHLPHGAIVTSCIVNGNAGMNDAPWTLKRIATDSTLVDMATANTNTADTTITSATIDNANYAYMIHVDNVDNADALYSARIIYTVSEL